MTAELPLLDTELESALRQTVRDVLRARCEPARIAQAYDGDRSLTRALWPVLAVDLGLAGLLVPESRGGLGASIREAAVLMEELGRSVAPVPFLESSVIATSVLLAGDGDLAADLASGRRTAALVVPFTATGGIAASSIRAEVHGLSGRVANVVGVLDADVLLVPVSVADGLEIRAVDADRASVEPVSSLDMTRPVADVRISGVTGDRVVTADRGSAAVDRALLLGASMLASEAVGVASWCLETTVTYLSERRQFGRTVASFQAVKHRLADLFAAVESAGAAARYAAATWAIGAQEGGADDDTRIATAVASSYCRDLAVHAAEEAVQLHGGLGMTWEYPAHLYLKRAKASQLGLGRPDRHREALARLVDLAV